MSQNRFLLSVLLVTATLSVCAAIECAQCQSPKLTVLNGITVPEITIVDTEAGNCEAKICPDTSNDVCTYGHYAITVDGFTMPEAEDAPEGFKLPDGTTMGMKQTWERGCGTKGLDMCAIIKTEMTSTMSEEDKQKLKVTMTCDIQTCEGDGCNTESEKTKEDMGVADQDPISCYSCSKSFQINDEPDQEDCTKTELCAEGIEHCFDMEVTMTSNGIIIPMWEKSCARADLLFLDMLDDNAEIDPTVTITSKSLKMCKGNLCTDYKENSAGINEPRMILLLVSVFFTILQLA